jgi:hypothetical protein
MCARLAKLIAVLLTGLALVCQGFALSTAPVAAAHEAAATCCAKGCTSCGSTSCCAAPADHRAPSAPAPQRSALEELQSIAPPAQTLFSLHAPAVPEFFPPAALPAIQDGTVPIFQRNCSFLI